MSGPTDARITATGIVLAGGRSSRFGSDKLVATIDGRPLLHLPILALAGVVDRIVIAAAPGSDPSVPAGLLDRITIVHDPGPHGGPLVGLGAALGAVGTGAAIVVGGDMPTLVPAVLDRLLTELRPARAAVLEVPGRAQPLPMALDVDAARDSIVRILASGGRSLRSLLADLDAVAIPAPIWLALDPGAATISDIDVPSDHRRLR